MKYQTTILSTAIVLALTGCGSPDKPSAPPAAPATPAPKASASAAPPTYIKPTQDRPAGIPAALAGVESCFLDAVNDIPAQDANAVPDKSKVKLLGWAGNLAKGSSPQEVWIEFYGAGTAYIKALRDVKRPDVASAFKAPGLVDAGWQAFVDLSALPSGVYKIRVTMPDGQQGSTCETKRTIQIN